MVLPHLAVLRLSMWGCPTDAARWCVGADQIARIAASCPALRQLLLLRVTPQGFDTACLDQLPAGVTSVEGLDWQRQVPQRPVKKQAGEAPLPEACLSGVASALPAASLSTTGAAAAETMWHCKTGCMAAPVWCVLCVVVAVIVCWRLSCS